MTRKKDVTDLSYPRIGRAKRELRNVQSGLFYIYDDWDALDCYGAGTN